MDEIKVIIDKDYVALVKEIKDQVKSAQLRAHRAVNTELIQLYWSIGKKLLERQKIEVWGSKYLGYHPHSCQNLRFMVTDVFAAIG